MMMMSNERSIQLDYEPHINLSINTKSADECHNLSDVRYQINTIDHFIIKLISDRMQYALAAVKFKLNLKPIPDNQRVIQQLLQRRKWAEEYKLDPNFIESFFKLLIDWYMTQQITRYQIDNPSEPSSQFRLSSLNELKAMEFNLTWIDISHYMKLLSSAYRKTREIDEPVLVSFTQKTSTSMHSFGLFEQARRRSLRSTVRRILYGGIGKCSTV
jgi:isochorismate pyruvate lyase